MKALSIKPEIYKYSRFNDFTGEFKIGKDDLIFTKKSLYESFMKTLSLDCDFLFRDNFGKGEPSNELIDKIINSIDHNKYKRIIAVGGGSLVDIAKLLTLKNVNKSTDLFEKKIPIIKEKKLIIVPTTCGTGSEVTNISIAEIKEKKTKMGLAVDELYADYAVLIPELIKGLPYKFFVYSSIDALIHGVESFVSPKSNNYTEIFSINAIRLIINGYKKILQKGIEYRLEIIEDFLIASNYAGIAFGNAGTGAVHALSYPLGGNYHVPHGEANYQFFTEVFKVYNELKPQGKIEKLNSLFIKLLEIDDVLDLYDALDSLLGKLLKKKKLREYGMKTEEIELFTDSVIASQQRLLANNYVHFSRENILNIYRKLY